MRERVRREELYERESKWRDKSESERKQKVKKNKISFFGLQFQDFTRPGNGQFLCVDAKIYQPMAYRRPDVNALRTAQNKRK